MQRFSPSSLIPGLMFILLSCNFQTDHKDKKTKKDHQPSDEKASVLASSSTGCDPSLWKYVYNPDRLEVADQCKTVTGIIEESNADEDGDQHMLLKLDKGQEDLINKRNEKKKQGDLVIEAVCVNNVLVKKVGNTCQGYVNHVMLPAIGDHVRVTGSYVNDSHNGWMEIHPISKIEKID